MRIYLAMLCLIIATAVGSISYFSVIKPANPWKISKKYPKYIVVDRSDFKLYYLEKGTVKKEFPVVIGKPRTKTPLGRWKVAKKIRFDKLGIYGYLKLQLARLEETKYIPTIYAIHGTDREDLLGRMPRMFSNGCVRMYNKDIAWLWKEIPKGTPVLTVP